MIVSLFVSSRASRARLHVNARTRPLRQTMRQTHTVALEGGEAPSQPRTSTSGSPLRSHGVAPRTEAPEHGPPARNSFNVSRERSIPMGNYRPMSATVAPSMRNAPTCCDLPRGSQPPARRADASPIQSRLPERPALGEARLVPPLRLMQKLITSHD